MMRTGIVRGGSVNPRPRALRLASWCGRAVLLAAALVLPDRASAQSTNADPRLDVEPIGGAAAVGESFGFHVVPGGTTPFAYQWYVNGSAMTGATNSELLLTNLTLQNAGSYGVIVTNTVGSVSSATAVLLIFTNAPRTIVVRGVSTAGSPASAKVPLLLSANGRESLVQLSLHYDTNAFQVPTFQTALTNPADVRLDTSRAGDGLVGLEVDPLPPATPAVGEDGTFAPGQTLLGHLLFPLRGAATALDGRLLFTNAPLAAAARDTNGLVMIMDSAVLPQVDLIQVQPVLNRQSGLFEQSIDVSNPSGTTFTNLDVLVAPLGVDSRSNAIYHANAQSVRSADVNGDGFYEIASVVVVGLFNPGASARFLMEYYVGDHRTTPLPIYGLQDQVTALPSVPAVATPIDITIVRQRNDTLIVEFPTRFDLRYYVQYAPTVNDLTNSAVVKTSLPPVTGTGSRVQWIDNGPPKTESLPTSGSRFYRVMESP